MTSSQGSNLGYEPVADLDCR